MCGTTYRICQRAVVSKPSAALNHQCYAINVCNAKSLQTLCYAVFLDSKNGLNAVL